MSPRLYFALTYIHWYGYYVWNNSFGYLIGCLTRFFNVAEDDLCLKGYCLRVIQIKIIFLRLTLLKPPSFLALLPSGVPFLIGVRLVTISANV
jgi:hypothetical protein